MLQPTLGSFWRLCVVRVLPVVTLVACLSFSRGRAGEANTTTARASRSVVLVAGKPSHPPRMHEFNAGVQLIARCLGEVEGLEVSFVLNGWPEDESVLQSADAIVFYMDGKKRHEVVQEGRRRLDLIDGLVRRGVGVAFMHYGVEVVPGQAGAEFKRWIGGHYEDMHSCNPIWEPRFDVFPDHEITRGVKPFEVKDEWYFNIRFIGDIDGNKAEERAGISFQPILVATPSRDVRDGPYVYPKGPYPHIQASAGRAEAMMWAVERPDGGRGFGFTGGHFHDNWANDEYRKVVLNAVLWLAKVPVPEGGVKSSVELRELDDHLDKKNRRR